MTDAQLVAGGVFLTTMVGAVGLFIRHVAGERSEAKHSGNGSSVSYMEGKDLGAMIARMDMLIENTIPLKNIARLTEIMHGEIAEVRSRVINNTDAIEEIRFNVVENAYVIKEIKESLESQGGCGNYEPPSPKGSP